MNCEYKILQYWNDSDHLYVEYKIDNEEIPSMSGLYTDYYNVSDIGCDYNLASDEEIKKCLKKLIEENHSKIPYPKVSELSPLLKYVYNFVCQSEANMCHIDYDDWQELIDEEEFIEEDISILKQEIEKYKLDDYITVDDGEYKICGYGGLQCCFNNDTLKEMVR